MSNIGPFHFRGPALAVTRIGPANAQKQLHNRKTIDLNGDRIDRPIGHGAPANRGIWVFPKGFEDAFFYAHVWDRRLPKHLQHKNIIDTDDDDTRSALWDQREEKMKKIIKDVGKKTLFWDRPFYSHIGYHGEVRLDRWFLWQNGKDWANIARKMVYTYYRDCRGNLFRVPYSSDHLELFLPM